MDPYRDQEGWRGEQLVGRFDQWGHQLTEKELVDLDEAIHAVEALGKPLSEVGPEDWRLSAFAKSLPAWMQQLGSGLGFILVRGFPVSRYSEEQAAIAYWLLARHMGTPVSQNSDGDLLGHVRDVGADPGDHNTRLYKTRAALSFHTDGADLIGLLCLRAGKSGGVSRICSSIWVFNEILKRRPDLAPLLLDRWHHHAHGQLGPSGPQTFEVPIVTIDGAIFRMFLLLWYIRNAADDFPETAGLSEKQLELLSLLETLPEEPGVALDMEFQPGDMQFLKNSVILHGRSAYEDHADSEQKRHLLRVWLSVPSFADGDALLRGGVSAEAAT